ncbi:MAG: hypothetical protein ISR45_05680 [Rhodospirillales bacterium]|nr:hypothetical protein [Rhodospirillales bacterium]
MRPMRVRCSPAAHSNELATINIDGASFMNVRAALSGMKKLDCNLFVSLMNWDSS